MIVRVRRVILPDADDVEVLGYSDQIPELGHAMHLWWESGGVVFHLRTGDVKRREEISGTGYKCWLVDTGNAVYNVLLLTQRMVDEIGIRGMVI